LIAIHPDVSSTHRDTGIALAHLVQAGDG
jgi:hypothetical protein